MNKKLEDTRDIVNMMVPTSEAIKKVRGKKGESNKLWHDFYVVYKSRIHLYLILGTVSLSTTGIMTLKPKRKKCSHSPLFVLNKV